MKQTLNKILSSLLAIIVLFSTFSFTVESHYCGERLVDTSIFSQLKTCGVEMEESLNQESEISKESCCRNEVSIVEGNIAHQQGLQKIELEQFHFIAAFVASYQNLFTNSYNQNLSNQLYEPPMVYKDVVLLFENFRI